LGPCAEHRWRRRLVAGLGLAVLWAGSALSARAAPEVARAAPSDDDRWRISVTPYVWTPALNAEVGVSSRLPTAKVDAPIGDVLQALGFAAMGSIEVRRDRFVATADLFYASLKVSKGVGIADPDFVHAGLGAKQFFSTLLAGYRVVDNGGQSIDLLVGLRVVSMDDSLDVSGPRRALAADTSKTWTDPIVGAGMRGRLTGKLGYSAYGDVGGFGAGPKLTWQLLGAVDYSVAKDWTLFAGWRHLDIDYSNDGFVFNGGLDGPIIGAKYQF